MNIDLLIKNGLALEYDKEPTINSIAILNGKILDIGKDLEQKYKASQIIDAADKIVMPGFVNTHSHVAMSYFKGLADDLPLQEWLSKHIWPVEAKFLSAEFVEDAALYGCAEMIKNGITTFSDMYFFGDQTAKSAEKVGIRAVLGEGVLDYPVANYQNADEIFAYIKKMHHKYLKSELIDFAVAPHAIYTCGKENLIKAKNLAQELGILLHIHLSETKKEVADCINKTGMRPVEYLDSLGFFEGNVVVAHAIWLNENEQNILAKNNTSVSINTSSNLKLASGFNSFRSYIEHGINLSLGTDGVASNNNLSMLQEISLTAKLQKALNDDPTFLPDKDMIKIATIGGAKALHKSNQIGSFEIGKKADIILIDVNNIETQPMYDPYSQLVYSLSSEQIKDVIINGKIVMKNRQLINIDAKELIEKAKYYQKKIIKFNSMK
ncbi:MAG: amidohydrolase [Candidatus Tenebribacter davisii]|jgi:5-methylthioadenosine/S-adenosylhomocysteine deaminase|nr:amidohydrolase [Candidatus Tenebribacter davisii]